MKIKIIILFCIASCLSCKKQQMAPAAAATINIVNAAIDLTAVKINPTGETISYKNTTDQVGYSAGKLYYAQVGVHGFEIVNSADTTKRIFNGNLDFESTIYTMYLVGQSPNIDTILRKESNLPFIKTDVTVPKSMDSVVYVRFVNLSPNSPTLKINIKNNTLNETDNLTFKSIGSWKSYQNKNVAATSYVFEIRDVTTNVILSTYTFSANATNRFKNVTLVIKGLVGTSGTNAFGVFPVNYF